MADRRIYGFWLPALVDFFKLNPMGEHLLILNISKENIKVYIPKPVGNLEGPKKLNFQLFAFIKEVIFRYSRKNYLKISGIYKLIYPVTESKAIVPAYLEKKKVQPYTTFLTEIPFLGFYIFLFLLNPF